ncbi:MAG: pilus assembly protein [Eggerthellales bacterium]|nr:pilus assembly protein [Eggerthellales bacterium]
MCSRTEGQATVEAAFLIPLFVLCILIAIQPAILLFDRAIIAQAAWEGCRLAHVSQEDGQRVEMTIRSHLRAIPDVAAFHVGMWQVDVQGGDTFEEVRVTVSHGLQLLPGCAQFASALGWAHAGVYEQEVEVSICGYETWVTQGELGISPEAWVSRWDDPL